MFSARLRRPTEKDGPALYDLVKRCPPLDENSRYCNLLQTSHFGGTAIVAERDGALCGFITGYRIPERPNTLFVWQVGVSPEGRGQGLAPRMLLALLERLDDVDLIETTVTPDNAASAAMFEKVAAELGAPINRSVLFETQTHFDGQHENEVLCRIGPFNTGRRQQTLQASA
jgi:L-2,4-diaminobutyric acid acetyltransferase